MPDELTLASLVANLGAVGGFIYYSIKSNRSNGEERQKREEFFVKERQDRDNEWRAFLQTQQTTFLESIALRDTHWADMFKLQAEQRVEAMSQGMDQMREVTDQIRGLVEIFSSHETSSGDRATQILEAIRTIRATRKK